MFFISLLYSQIITAVFPSSAKNEVHTEAIFTHQSSIAPSCLLFLLFASLVPFLFTYFPHCAEVFGRGRTGQGALHARAGEVSEDRSLQAFQKEGPGEAEGQADQGRWGRPKPLRTKITYQSYQECLCKCACDSSRLTVLLSVDVLRLTLKVLGQQSSIKSFQCEIICATSGSCFICPNRPMMDVQASRKSANIELTHSGLLGSAFKSCH